MTSELPAPNSIWKQRDTRMPMRVTPGVDGNGNPEVIAHNCELAMHFLSMELISWRGSIEAFHALFSPTDQPYPRLAS